MGFGCRQISSDHVNQRPIKPRNGFPHTCRGSLADTDASYGKEKKVEEYSKVHPLSTGFLGSRRGDSPEGGKICLTLKYAFFPRREIVQGTFDHSSVVEVEKLVPNGRCKLKRTRTKNGVSIAYYYQGIRGFRVHIYTLVAHARAISHAVSCAKGYLEAFYGYFFARNSECPRKRNEPWDLRGPGISAKNKTLNIP